MMNNYFKSNIESRKSNLPTEIHQKLVKEASFLTELGVQNEEDHKIYFYLGKFGHPILKEMGIRDSEAREKLVQSMFRARNQVKPDTIYNIYRLAAIAIKESNFSIKKMAYLQNLEEQNFHVAPRDINKWVKTVHAIYDSMNKFNTDFATALAYHIQNWDSMEKADFKKWISFYQEGAQDKYKTAQYIEAVNDQLRGSIPGIPRRELTQEESVAKKIKSLISRLDSAEKLARDADVQRWLSPRLDMSLVDWLEQLQRVKRFVMTTPLKSVRAGIIDSLIVREANRLIAAGYELSGYELMKIAQVKPEIPMVPPLQPAPVTQDIKPIEPSEQEEGEEAINKLIKGLNFSDSNETEDDEVLSVTAQLEPPGEPLAEIPTEALPPENVIEDAEPLPEIAVEEPEADGDALDMALQSVTIAEVIEDWEAIANIFRNREINRMLAKVDLKMNAMGISAFFPSVGEISNKNFDCSQYSLTRTDEIISQLRGSFDTSAREVVEDMSRAEQPSPNPSTNALREQLKKEKNKEEFVKHKKREQEQNKFTQPEIVEAPEAELAAPVTLNQPPMPAKAPQAPIPQAPANIPPVI